MAHQVLTYAAGLPPIELVSNNIHFEDLAGQATEAEAYLIPCRASGLNFRRQPIFWMSDRSARNWTMLACERSRQIHRHFYGEDAPCVEMCPRQLTQSTATPTLLKCCLLEDGVEIEDNYVIVPWGANLAQVEEGLRALAEMNSEHGRKPQRHESLVESTS